MMPLRSHPSQLKLQVLGQTQVQARAALRADYLRRENPVAAQADGERCR